MTEPDRRCADAAPRPRPAEGDEPPSRGEASGSAADVPDRSERTRAERTTSAEGGLEARVSYCLRLRVLDLSALSPAIREAEPSQCSAQEQECGRFRDGSQRFQLAPDFPTHVAHGVDVEGGLVILDSCDRRGLSLPQPALHVA